MPELVSKWKDASGAVHDTFAECVIGEIACVLGKVGSGDASFAPAIARKIVEKADDIIDQLTFLKEHLQENPTEREPLRKTLGLPDPSSHAGPQIEVFAPVSPPREPIAVLLA